MTGFLARSLPAVAATLLFAACVDLTPPWDKKLDDAAAGGSGGSATANLGQGGTRRMAAGGINGSGAGGAGGTVAVDAVLLAEVKSSGDGGVDVPFSGDTNLPTEQGSGGGTGGMAAGGAGGAVVADAAASADATSSRDLNAEFPPDTNPPSDGGTGDFDGGGSGETGGIRTDGATTPMIISIDFIGGRTTGTAAMTAGEAAGVKRATHWNGAAGKVGTLSSLVAADGSATSASVTWNSPLATGQPTAIWSVGFTDTSGDADMMNGYLDPRSAALPATVDVTLPASISGGYDVYVYCYANISAAAPDTRTYQYAIGSMVHTVTQAGPSASTFPGYAQAGDADAGQGSTGNYVVFRNLSGTTFELTARPVGSVNGVERAPVNGIQIVYPAGF